MSEHGKEFSEQTLLYVSYIPKIYQSKKKNQKENTTLFTCHEFSLNSISEKQPEKTNFYLNIPGVLIIFKHTN